jgi:hypothetical protein
MSRSQTPIPCPALLKGLLVAALALLGCVGPGASSTARPGAPQGAARLTFVDYRTKVRMTLINEAHTGKVEFYSQKRANANTKITTNEIMGHLLARLEDQGFNGHAQPGSAPLRGAAGELQSLELNTREATVFLVNSSALNDEARTSFRQCRLAFMQIQEITSQAQSVDDPTGRAVFQPERPGRPKN